MAQPFYRNLTPWRWPCRWRRAWLLRAGCGVRPLPVRPEPLRSLLGQPVADGDQVEEELSRGRHVRVLRRVRRRGEEAAPVVPGHGGGGAAVDRVAPRG